MKCLYKLSLRDKETLGANITLLKYNLPSDAPEMTPGQFVNVRITGAENTLLRRPISINFIDKTNHELWLLVQEVGNGTERLCETRVGEKTDILLPLGKGFSLPEKNEKVILIGGGVGVAPLLFLGSEIKRMGVDPTFLLGGRRAENMVELNLFNTLGETFVTTEDGSLGEMGLVINHSILKERNFDKIYVCGPKPMMKAVVAYAQKKGIKCEVSLENRMACGIGVCLCCVEKTKKGHQCVCSEGPVFDASELDWE